VGTILHLQHIHVQL
jgi:hypothetical protein